LGFYARNYLENFEHPGIAEGVGLHTLKIQELRDTFIVGTEKLLVDIWFNGRALNFGKSMFSKKSCFKS